MIYGERGYCLALTAARRAHRRASTNEAGGVREKEDVAGPGRLGGGGAGRGGAGIRLLRLGRAG